MADHCRSISIEELPSHLILEILCSRQLTATDLVSLELTCGTFRGTFRGSHGLFPHKLKSLVDFAAFQLCGSRPIYDPMGSNARKELFDCCRGNRKRVLRVLQSVEQSSNIVKSSAGNVLFL